MRMLVTSLLLAVSTAMSAPFGQLVTVRMDGTISPAGFVETVSGLAAVQAQSEGLRILGESNAQSADMASQTVVQVRQIINGIEGIGYIRGYVLSFGAGIEADTNMTASIIKFEPAGTTSTSSLWRAYTFFTQDPGIWPVVHYTDSLSRTGSWQTATQVSVIRTNTLVGDTLYDCYASTVAMPLDATQAFFRVFADVSGVGTNTTYMPVRNGISVNGAPGLTLRLTSGTNVIAIVGGVHVR